MVPGGGDGTEHANADTEPIAHSHPNGDADGYPNPDRHAHRDAKPDGNGHR
jgi:hypothetical protein